LIVIAEKDETAVRIRSSQFVQNLDTPLPAVSKKFQACGIWLLHTQKNTPQRRLPIVISAHSNLTQKAKQVFRKAQEECDSEIRFFKKGPDGASSEQLLTEDKIDSLSLEELASTRQKRPIEGLSWKVDAFPMLPLTTPIQRQQNEAAAAEREKRGCWIDKGVWLKEGELPPQRMVIDTGYGRSPQYTQYTNSMKHMHGTGTDHIDQVR
jgi:hypothetical protein